MAALRRAVELGFKDFAQLQKDAEFDPLRLRPDSQELAGHVADLWFPRDVFAH
jgi:hypothetical protein